MTAFRAVLLLSLFCVAAAESGSGAVVQRVVSLIEELKAKIQQDGKIEQKMYDKYACWCETTSSRKANDIHQAMTDIKVLMLQDSRDQGSRSDAGQRDQGTHR